MNYFLSNRAYRHTDRQTHRQTDTDEYSVVAVEKPQLLLDLRYANGTIDNSCDCV